MSDYVPLTFMYCSEYISLRERKSATISESEASCNTSLIQSQLSMQSKRNCILHGELLTNFNKNLNSFRRLSSRNKRDWEVYLSAILTQESDIVRFFIQPMPINVFRHFNFSSLSLTQWYISCSLNYSSATLTQFNTAFSNLTSRTLTQWYIL